MGQSANIVFIRGPIRPHSIGANIATDLIEISATGLGRTGKTLGKRRLWV